MKIGNSAPSQVGLDSLLDFRPEVVIDGQSLSKSELEQLMQGAEGLQLIRGSWVEVDQERIREALNHWKKVRASHPDGLELVQGMRLLAGATISSEEQSLGGASEWTRFEAGSWLRETLQRMRSADGVLGCQPGRDLQATLRPYQVRGVQWLWFMTELGLGACLADDMGLGKTIQFIAFLLNLYQQKELKFPYLLICPTSVLTNWEREVKRFAPDLKCGVHHGEKRSKGKSFKSFALEYHLVITSYSLVHRDLADFKTVSWQGVVLDEAQNIKNAEAKQSISVRELATTPRKDQPLPFRIALTGTPVENRLTELWSIMEFLNPGYLGTKAFFQRRFMMPIERYGDRDSLQALRSLVQPFILRRLKTDRSIIQDLPEKQEMILFCEMEDEQRRIYDAYRNDFRNQILGTIETQGIQKSQLTILQGLMKLRQICDSPAILNEQEKFEH